MIFIKIFLFFIYKKKKLVVNIIGIPSDAFIRAIIIIIKSITIKFFISFVPLKSIIPILYTAKINEKQVILTIMKSTNVFPPLDVFI